MKKVIAVIIALGILSLGTAGFANSSYPHQTAICASVESRQPSVWLLQRLGDDFFKQKNVRTVNDYPLAIRSVFTKGKDIRVYMVSRWHGFDPEESYTFSCEWIDPDGESYSTSAASFETPENLDAGVFFTYTAYLDVGQDMKEGEWRVNIHLNGDLVEARDLTIASE